MVFTSLTFPVFYVIVFALYWPLTKDWQNRLIVISGLIFYGWWDWRFAVLLLITTGIDYLVGLALEREAEYEARAQEMALGAYRSLDPRMVLALAMKELGENAHRVGNLTITSEILAALLNLQPAKEQ